VETIRISIKLEKFDAEKLAHRKAKEAKKLAKAQLKLAKADAKAAKKKKKQAVEDLPDIA
jgi:hypothetical protein